MRKKPKDIKGLKKWSFIVVLLVMAWGNVFAQQLFIERKAEVDLTKKALDQIYNFQFNEAEKNMQSLEEQFGNRPGLNLLKALHIYWKNLPLNKGSDGYKKYEELLNLTARQAEDLLKKDKNDVEGIFFTLAAYGNLAAFYADEASYMKALNHARKAYAPLKKGFELKEEFAEFYFTTGLYNYYREIYPEKYPIYKPFIWLFQSGDKRLGINQIKIASSIALFTKAEADSYLFHIHLRYEKNPAAAMPYSRKLHEAYPANLLFQAYHAESLVFGQKYKDAERLVENLVSSEMPFYKIPGHIFRGMLLEKYHHNLKDAEDAYLTALELADADNFEFKYYKSLAWSGLARIADHHGDNNKAKEYYSRSLKLTSYDIVSDEAKEYGR
jgi:hypothetical protein